MDLLSIVRNDPVSSRYEWAYHLDSTHVHGKRSGMDVELNALHQPIETLGGNKLCCEVFASNDLWIRIHEKYGSVVEGSRRQHVFHDIVEMGIPRSNWEQNVRDAFERLSAQFE